MKRILFVLLSLFSIVGFGQSDLEIIPIYVNADTFGDNNRHEHVIWGFNASNNGSTEASVVPYTIYFSTDNILDVDDLEVHTGNLGDDHMKFPSSGIDANSTVERSSHLVTDEDFYIPWNFEANDEYFFIFKIDQDIAGGEVNVDNNISILPFYLTLDDKLTIQHVDYNEELGNKTPLLLIHGWQPTGFDADGKTSIWDNFLEYFYDDDELPQLFKPYYVKYSSNIVPINDLGHELRIDLDNWFGTDYTGNINIVAHSMGGLVSRSFMNRNRDIGPHAGDQGGVRVNKLITLGSPHHGSHMANGEIRVNVNAIIPLNAQLYVSLSTTVDFSESLDFILDGYFQINNSGFSGSQSYNRWDLRWDNFDNFFDYSNEEEEINEWLNGSLMNGDTLFDNKIIAYVGEVHNERIPFIQISAKTLKYYYLGEQFLSNIEYINDGIVPSESAEFKGHTIFKKRIMYDYYHDEMAKGRFDYIAQTDTDYGLFGLIEADLRGNVSNSIISPSLNYSLTYPNTALNNSSSKEITIQNTGDLPLTISSIRLVGTDNAQFNFNFPTVPFDLQSNQSESFVVDFAPTSIGVKDVIFRINNSSVNNPQLDILLTGLAVETAETDYDTNIDPVYNFGDVYVYEGAKLVSLTVSNSSSAPYTIAGLTITGSNANLFSIVQQPVLPKLFNPGDSEIIVLSFNPDTVGEKTAVIEASFQDNTILDTANLIGNGVNTIDNPNASKLTQYEYWFNDDYFSKQTSDLSGTNSLENLDFDAVTIGVNKGLNTLHFRVKDEENHWSSVLSEFVYVQNASNSANNLVVEYEYWFDDDYVGRIVGNGNGTNSLILNINDNVGSLETGLHQFYIRFKDEKGAWSSIVSEFIYNNKPSGLGDNKIATYRHWFNDDFAGRTSGTFTPEETIVFLDDIDASGLTVNTTNYIHFQFKDIYGNWSSVLTEEFLYEALVLNPTVFLQGALINPFSGEEDLMRDDLRIANLLPITSPYSDGITTTNPVLDITGSDAIVDWVWIELRDATDRTVIVEGRSALLQRDGDVVDIDGTSGVSFHSMVGNYYVLVNHRNHLGILSANPIGISINTPIDLSANPSAVFGGSNAVLDVGGTYAMYSGDFDENGQIQNTDGTAVIPLLGSAGYTAADMDLNGQVQIIDINNIITPNTGSGEQL